MSPDVVTHPLIFVTLTAPGFGAVHTAHDGGRRCRPGRGHCAHGRPRSCRVVHETGDPLLGQPLCPGCYDYEGTVLWNARATELWRRTRIGARRAVARRLGLKMGEAEKQWSLAFVKIAEYQQRGVVHFHALLRLDAGHARATGGNDVIVAAMRTAIARTAVAHPTRPDEPIRWGLQADLTPIDTEDRPRLAWYVAKYATKSVDTGGALDHRLHHGDLAAYPLPDHLRRLAETAWALGGDPELESLNLRHWAHTLGYRGHWLTKSRTWSTTLGRLRQDRYDWQARRHGEDADDELVREGDWTYQGTGHQNEGDLWLSQVAHRNHQTNRRTAWEEQ